MPPVRRVDPNRRRGLIFRGYGRIFGTTRPAMWFARTLLWKVDPHLLRLTGGRLSLAIALPTGLLETCGARTGATRRHGVIYFHDGDRVTIIASKFGEPGNPAWFHNARACPDVRFNGQTYRAAVVEDEGEQTRLWVLADRVFPAFAIYRRRASAVGRTIPILQLTARDV